jgi:uncharacterized membrane protein YccC
VVKTSVAAVASWLICEPLFDQAPIFAAIAALLVVQPSVNQTLLKGVERSLGVLLGVVLALGVGNLLGTDSWAVLIAVVLALLLSWVLRLGPGSATQIPISAMLVLAIGSLTGSYALERIVETVIGAVIGLLVNLLIVPPVSLAPAHLAVARLLREVAARMDDLAHALTIPQSRDSLRMLLEHARELRPQQTATTAALAQGRESLTLNPRGGRHRRILDRDDELFDRLVPLVTRIIGMTRTVHDHWRPGLETDAIVGSIAEELRRAAHDLRLVGRELEGGDAAQVTPEPPALTAPLVVARPDAEDWILLGSLLEDLRRVRDEILGAAAE